MNIDMVHKVLVHCWIWGPLQQGPHTDFENTPPWNPTLLDVENTLVQDGMGGKLIQILKYKGGCIHLDLEDLSMQPLYTSHIDFVKRLCDEFEDLREEVANELDALDDEAFDYDSEEDADYPMEPLSPETQRIVNLELDAAAARSQALFSDGSPYTEEEWRILNLDVSASTSELSASTSETTNNLCNEGVQILDRIMNSDTRVLNEGDYLKLCNLFRDLHT